MPPKKKQSGQKATTQPRAVTPVGARRSTSKATTQKADNRDVARLSSIGEDSEDSEDFENYRQWLQRAGEESHETTLSQAREYWKLLPEERAAAFADAVRALQNEEGVRHEAEVALRELLRRVSAFKYSDERRDQRRVGREAGDLYQDLVVELEVWQSVTEGVLSRLDAVEDTVAEMPQEGPHSLLEAFHKGLKKQIKAVLKEIGSWITEIQQIPHNEVWTLEYIQRIQGSARDIEIYLSTAKPSSQPLAGSSSSSSKRKRQGDAEGSSPKVPRGSEHTDVAGNGSAKVAPHNLSSIPPDFMQRVGTVNKPTLRDL